LALVSSCNIPNFSGTRSTLKTLLVPQCFAVYSLVAAQVVALPFAFEQVEAWFPLSIMLSWASAVFFLFHFFVDWIF
jgi:hypothetical protein